MILFPTRALVHLAVAATIVAGASAAAQAPSVYQAKRPRTPQQWAVLIGTEQQGQGPETTSALQNVGQILQSRYNFPADHVTVLVGERATREAIMEALARTAARTQPSDDMFVVVVLPRTEGRGRAASYLVPADGRPDDPVSLVAVEEVWELMSPKSPIQALAITPGCRASTRSLATQVQTNRSAFSSELSRFLTAIGFCVAGDTRDRSRGSIAVELQRYLDQRAQSGEPFSAFEFASDFTDELRPRSVIADILSVGEGAREQFMFVPGLDALARSLARLSDTNLQIRNAAVSDVVKVALGEPESRRAASIGRASAALMNIARDELQPESLRHRAVQGVGDLRDVSAIPNLRSLYRSRDAEMREEVVASVARMPGAAAVDLLRTATKDADPSVRSAAVRGLGASRDEGSFPIVLEMMRSDLSADVRLSALQTSLLYRGQRDAARQAIVPMLKDADPGVRREAASALGALDPDPNILELVAALRAERSDPVREALIYALGRSSTRPVAQPVESTLLAALAHANPVAVRVAAASTLGDLGVTRAGQPLLLALDDTNEQIKTSAAEAVGKLKYRPAIDKLVAMLRDKSPNVRRAAATGLGGMDDQRATNALLVALKDSDPYVSASAGDAIKRSSGSRDLQVNREVEAALRDPSPEVRLRAARALANVDDPARGALLVPALGDDDDNVRRVAIDALSAERRATPANIDALVQALGSKDARTLLSALVVVGNIAARPTHPPLTAVDAPLAQLLKHPASDVRAQAVRTAGATRNPQWLAPLVSAAQDSAANVRQAAAQALGQYPSAQAEEALRRLLGDEVPEVRLAALESMRRIRPK